MEEEYKINDLEERLYAMIHHVDETQADETALPSEDMTPRVEAPRSTVRRYWNSSYHSAYQKTNGPRDAAPPASITPATGHKTAPATPARAPPDNAPKEEKNDAPGSPPSDLLVLRDTVPQNYVKTVEILEIDEPPHTVELETSDEDEVVEVKLPPKPTITIESSDEEELVQKPDITATSKAMGKASKENKSPNNRDISASPVLSVVSTISDDFIRGDCIAMNISSAQPDNECFDFSLHGSDLIGDGTPSKKKKKKKSKDRLTSTPIAAQPNLELKKLDNIFATPKSKAKNKKQKSKSYAVSEKSIPNADVYDSDSNQSVIDTNKNHDVYIVTEKSFPNADVYESDSSIVETVENKSKLSSEASKQIDLAETSDSNTSMELSMVLDSQKTSPNNQTKTSRVQSDRTIVIDLDEDFTTDENMIQEDFVMGNVTGFTESEDYGDDSLLNQPLATDPQGYGKFCSTKVPQILYEDLDFDNLKGKSKVCSRRRFSLTTLRAEMEKFYNESWGGENFNHQEIQKNMSRDKSLWMIDPKDRMPNPPKRRITCNYCNRVGHRDDTCRFRPPVCHMCGETGHYEPRCPRKICVNCGSPNFVYSMMCRNCAAWVRLQCAECGRVGHPASHCPDLWRRYHNTIDENMPLERTGEKPAHQQFCSGCAQRGHLVHACRGLPFGPVAPPAAAVARYRRLYPPAPDGALSAPHKRPSRSPHEARDNKSTSESEQPKKKGNEKAQNRELAETAVEETVCLDGETERAPDFIPIASANRDKRGHVIQDNEVSDTSEVVTSARVYVAEDVIRRMQTPEGQNWLKESTEKLQLVVHHTDSQSFLTVKGTVGAQEAFQSEFREWARGEGHKDAANDAGTSPAQQEKVKITFTLPKKKNDVLRTLGNAFEALKQYIGDPKAMYKELMFLQNHHESLVHQRVVSPVKLSNNRDNMNTVVKKLNMVLLGQAGLAGGARHVAALHALRQRLAAVRAPRVPAPLRDEIGLHYRLVFTAAPRDDYDDLLRKFYLKKRPVLAKKRKNDSIQSGPNNRQAMKKNPLQGWQVDPLVGAEGDAPKVDEAKKRHMKVMPINILKNKMMFYRQRLLHARFPDTVRDQQRCALVDKLQKHIMYLFSTEPGKKMRKKMRKSCALSQSFLSDV